MMTAEQMQALAEQGRHWWMKPTGEFYATAEYDDDSPDLYLVDASPSWLQRWPDWASAIEELRPQFEVLDTFRQQ